MSITPPSGRRWFIAVDKDDQIVRSWTGDGDAGIDVLNDGGQILAVAPHALLFDAEAKLWKCFETTGADTSDGTYTGWPEDAVRAVVDLREERDRLADLLEDTQVLLDKLAHRIRETT